MKTRIKDPPKITIGLFGKAVLARLKIVLPERYSIRVIAARNGELTYVNVGLARDSTARRVQIHTFACGYASGFSDGLSA
jgi:hypothetical protein